MEATAGGVSSGGLGPIIRFRSKRPCTISAASGSLRFPLNLPPLLEALRSPSSSSPSFPQTSRPTPYLSPVRARKRANRARSDAVFLCFPLSSSPRILGLESIHRCSQQQQPSFPPNHPSTRATLQQQPSTYSSPSTRPRPRHTFPRHPFSRPCTTHATPSPPLHHLSKCKLSSTLPSPPGNPPADRSSHAPGASRSPSPTRSPRPTTRTCCPWRSTPR